MSRSEKSFSSKSQYPINWQKAYSRVEHIHSRKQNLWHFLETSFRKTAIFSIICWITWNTTFTGRRPDGWMEELEIDIEWRTWCGAKIPLETVWVNERGRMHIHLSFVFQKFSKSQFVFFCDLRHYVLCKMDFMNGYTDRRVLAYEIARTRNKQISLTYFEVYYQASKGALVNWHQHLALNACLFAIQTFWYRFLGRS